MENEQLEQLLMQALSSTAEPSEALNQKIKERIKEDKTVKPVRKKMAAAFIAAAIFIMSGSVFAAWQLLSPKQVAENFGDKTLAEAFSSENAVQINKAITSGDYTFTLLGITSGKNLSDFKSTVQDINPDRTYAVVSIAKSDGSPMPEINDEEYNKPGFIVSPLIKGQKPWQVNIFTMNGGYSECVVDGVAYRMIECDNIEMFADRGVYLFVGTGMFINNQTVSYNEETGEISLNANNNDASAIFDLPLDVKKADYEKAEKYLEELLNPNSEPTTEVESLDDWENELVDAVVIPESIKEVTYDEDGFACYEYGGSKNQTQLDYLLEYLEVGVWKTLEKSWDDKEVNIIQYLLDENGVITGRTLKKSK